LFIQMERGDKNVFGKKSFYSSQSILSKASSLYGT
jgi:hypothetical protein